MAGGVASAGAVAARAADSVASAGSGAAHRSGIGFGTARPRNEKKIGGALMEVDLRTSLPSWLHKPGRLPCSVTRLLLLGVQDSAVRGKVLQWIRMRGSS